MAADRVEEETGMLPEENPLKVDQCHCFATRKAARQITRFYDSHLEPTGLHITQFLILATLNELGSVPLYVLADRLDIERTAMGKLVGFLERDGLVGLQRSPTDGRSRVAEITEEGRRAHDRASPLWLEAQRQFELANGAEKAGLLHQELRFPDLARVSA
jgi:DNA-binding MarR family transcriptional regulator